MSVYMCRDRYGTGIFEYFRKLFIVSIFCHAKNVKKNVCAKFSAERVKRGNWVYLP